MEQIALHRAVFEFPSGARIDIESALGSGAPLYSPPPIPHLLRAESEIQASEFSSGGMPPMRWLDSGALFERFQLREDTDYYVDVTVPVPAAEAAIRARKHEAWPFDQRLSLAFKRDPARRWRDTSANGKPATVITGLLRLKSRAGVVALATEFSEPFFAEVACRKLKYFEEFKELLDDLADEVAELLLSFDSPVSAQFGTDEDREPERDTALYFLMRMVMSERNLPLAAEEMSATPHSRLIDIVESSPVEEIEEPDPELIVDGLDLSTLSRGGPLSRFFRGHTPKELPKRETQESVDTLENRYAKAFLVRCRDIVQRLERCMASRRSKAAEREARAWGMALDDMLQRSLWKSVGPLTRVPSESQVLLRRRGYKELFKFDSALRASLALSWKEGARLADGLIGDIRPVNQIYEYWCFLALRKILDGVCRSVGGGNFIIASKDGLSIQLAKGSKSECCFEFDTPSGIVDVSLFYNKRFQRPKDDKAGWSGSYTAAFHPDFSVRALPRAAGAKAHWLHFDAKYRLEWRELDEIFGASNGEDDEVDQDEAEPSAYVEEVARVHKQDDLFKMHTYRDGILGSRGAYVLFPGDCTGGDTEGLGLNLFVRHPSAFAAAPQHRVPSVGAFSLAPHGGAAQLDAIASLLAGAFELVASGKSYSEEDAFF